MIDALVKKQKTDTPKIGISVKLMPDSIASGHSKQ